MVMGSHPLLPAQQILQRTPGYRWAPLPLVLGTTTGSGHEVNVQLGRSAPQTLGHGGCWLWVKPVESPGDQYITGSSGALMMGQWLMIGTGGQ